MGRSKRLAIDDGSWAYRFEYFNDPVAPTVIGGFRDVADYVELDTAGGFDDPLYVDADRISPPHVVVWAKGLVSFDLVTERQAIFMAVANANTLFSRFPGTGSSIGYIDPAGYDTIGVGVRQDERSIGKFRYFEASLQIEFKDTVTFNFSETAIFIEGVFQQPANIPARPAQALTTNGTDEDNVIDGSAAAQTINGLGGNDTITVGAAGCDVDGGSGNDTILGAQANCNLFGGDDNDTITAGEANYVEGGSGNDTITASGLFTTKGYFDGGAGFDRAVLDFSAFGNDITLTLRSDGGNTHLIRSEAATFAYVDIETFTIQGGSGADTLTGSDTADTLYGNGGQDILDGGTGADILNGGADNDTFYVDNTADNVIEASTGGTGDVVFAAVSYTLHGRYIETLTLTGTEAINATGNSKRNTLIGNGASNLLDGMGGADKMAGGLGNDTYVVDNWADVVTEGSTEGTADVILSSVSYTLAGRFIETLTLTGTKAINATGNSKINTLIGNSADNVLDGLGGADKMIGGLGNDTYIVDNKGDVVTEGSAEGTADAILSSVSYNLGGRFIETMTLTGGANVNAVGNGQANTLTGNTGANWLSGLGGSDILSGGAGSDRLLGGDGQDTLTGGSNADEFRFETALAGHADTITDFVHGTDRIGLSAAAFGLGAGALDPARFSGSGAPTAATGQFLYSAANHTLSWDADGTGGGSAVLLATLNASAGLTASDLFVF